MGLTWIDYDTIEKPIEEITVGTGEAKDIEFTVETLKCDIKKPGNGLTKKVEHKNWFVLLVAEGSAHGHAKSIFLSQNTQRAINQLKTSSCLIGLLLINELLPLHAVEQNLACS